jgi:hypothetical protein
VGGQAGRHGQGRVAQLVKYKPDNVVTKVISEKFILKKLFISCFTSFTSAFTANASCTGIIKSWTIMV